MKHSKQASMPSSKSKQARQARKHVKHAKRGSTSLSRPVQNDVFSKLILNILKNYVNPLAPDKIGIKEKILCGYQLKTADLYNVLISIVKKLVPSFFDKEKYVLPYENLQLFLRLGLKLKKYIAS